MVMDGEQAIEKRHGRARGHKGGSGGWDEARVVTRRVDGEISATFSKAPGRSSRRSRCPCRLQNPCHPRYYESGELGRVATESMGKVGC